MIPSPFPTVCTSAWTPMVLTEGDDQASWSGYGLDLYRGVASKLNWDPDSWQFISLNWDDMEAMLDNGTCSIAAAGVDINVDNLERGWIHSFPIYTRAYGILTTLTYETEKLFGFLSPFSLELWIAVLFSCLATAALVWFAEVWAHHSAHAPRPRKLTAEEKRLKKKPLPVKSASVMHREAVASKGVLVGSLEYFYMVIGKALNVTDAIHVKTAVSKFLLLFWGLAMVVILATYSASLTANLTVSRVKGGVTGIADLPGKAVGTWDPYVDQLKQYNVFSTPYAWENTEDEKIMVQDLLDRKVVAFVLDNVFVRYLAQNSDCKLQQVGTDFQYVDLGITFPAGTDPAIVEQINDALIALKQEGFHEILEKRYMGRDNRCLTSGLNTASTAISFSSLKGLWVLGGAWYGVALLFLLLVTIHHRRRASQVGDTSAILIMKGDHLASIEVMSEVADSRAPSMIGGYRRTTQERPSQTPALAPPPYNANGHVNGNGHAHPQVTIQIDAGHNEPAPTQAPQPPLPPLGPPATQLPPLRPESFSKAPEANGQSTYAA